MLSGFELRTTKTIAALRVSSIIILALVAGCMVAVNPLLSLVSLLLVIVTVVCWTKPALFIQALLVLSLALPTSYMTTNILSVSLFGYNMLWTDVLLAIAVIRWLAGIYAQRQGYGLLGRRFRYLIFGLLLWTSMGMVWGFLQNHSLAIILYDARSMLYYVVLFMAMDFLDNERALALVSRGLILGLVLYAVFSLTYFFMGDVHPLASVLEIQVSAFPNRIAFTNENMLIVALPLVVLLMAEPSLPLGRRLLLVAGLLLLATKLVISLGRGNAVLVIAAILMSLMVNEVFSRKSNLVRASLSGISLFIGLTAVATVVFNVLLPALLGSQSSDFIMYFFRRFNLRSQEVMEYATRVESAMLRAGFKAVLRNPVFGQGYGFLFHIEGWRDPISFIDNAWVTLWIRSGLIGLFLLAGLVVVYARSIYRALHSLHAIQDAYVRALYCAMAGGGLALLIFSLVNAWWVNSTGVLPLLIVVGASLRYSDRQAQDDYRGFESEPSEHPTVEISL